MRNENVYLLVFKLKDRPMENKKYYSKHSALKKYNSMLKDRPKPVSQSLYHRGELICYDGDGSHHKRKK